MPQLDIELIFENVFSFYLIFVYLLGQQIILNIRKNAITLKLRKFFVEYYNYQTLYLMHEKMVPQNHCLMKIYFVLLLCRFKIETEKKKRWIEIVYDHAK